LLFRGLLADVKFINTKNIQFRCRLSARPLCVSLNLSSMRNRIFVLVILLVGFHSFSFAQSKTVDDENLEKLLLDFLIEQNQISNSDLERFTPSIILVNALDYSAFDSSTVGIFKFEIAGSHQRPFLFVYDGQKIDLIKDYSIQNILRALTEFFSRNDSHFSNQQKLQYLENIIEIINTSQNPPGWYEMPENFIIPDSLKQ